MNLLKNIISISLFSCSFSLAQENPSYLREEIPLPEGEVIEVGSIALMPDNKVALSTRRGDIWICEGAYEKDLSKIKWSKFAEGLHEPFGMYWKDGWLYLTQRPEFTRIRDRDGDGLADEFETINSDWGINGDYHEYAFGSTPDKNGDTWIVLCLTGSGAAYSDFRGWGVRITKEGEMIPTVSGVRSPGGIGFNAEGDAFYTDNQGLWNGSSSLKHLKPGGFMGNPTGNKYFELTDAIGPRPVDPPLKEKSTIEEQRKRIKELVPPAVVLPHSKVGQSPTAVITDHTGGKFGPFANQVLVGEQTHSQVQRVVMEKVNGVYQGVALHFLEGFRSGIVPMALSDDGTLFVGGTSRGWGARGGKQYTFERVRYTGVPSFEIYDVKIEPDGFKINFTEEIDAAIAAKPESYKFHAWTYHYQAGYGSPEILHEKPQVLSADVSEDKKSVTLKLDKIIKGHVHEIDASALRSAKESKPLLHSKAYYTVNEIPSE